MHSVKVSHGTGDGGRGKRVVLVHDKASSAEASAEPQQFIEVTSVHRVKLCSVLGVIL